MRPLSLILDGFRSFADAVEIDWRDRSLVGIVGPIGSGKSSILDGVCFALYGKTPTERSNIRSLIHQRADAGKVELVFAVEGEIWKAVRAIRRKGQSQHALYRLDRDDEEASSVEEILGKSEVDARIVELLGLDFEGFNRSVMLAQGRFSEFLGATSTDRDKVLKGVFGLDRIDRMEVAAKARRDAALRDIDELGRRKADLETAKQLARMAEEKLAAATKRRDELQTVSADVAANTVALAAADAKAQAAAGKTRALLELSDEMPDADASRQIISDAGEAGQVVAAATAVLATATTEHDASKATFAKLVESAGGNDGLAESRRLATQRLEKVSVLEGEQARHKTIEARLAEAGTTASNAGAAAEKAAAGLEVATSRLEQARSRAAEARTAYDEAIHADMAASLRAGLSAGDPCPVCDRPLEEVPKSAKASATDTLLAALTEAQDLVVAYARAVTEATAAAAAAAVEQTSAAERTVEAKARLAESAGTVTAAMEAVEVIDARLKELLGDDPVGRLAGLERELVEADHKVAVAGTGRAEAESALAAARQAEEATRSGVASLAARVARLAGRLDLAVTAEGDDLGAALSEVRSAWVIAQQEAQQEADSARDERAKAVSGQAAVLESVGLSADEDFGESLSHVRLAVERLTSEVETRQELIAAATGLDEQVRALTATHAVYDQLARDLRPSAFLGFLLEEERAELASVGSARFEELSGGRYRFTDDGSFDIVDLTAAEGVRKSDTLSGGETFLASLALALALAEMVARGTGRLDAFFLDEGFGSLDTEHLELAMAGIEELVVGHEDRLVVVVSHVAEMQQRLEDLIILDKDPVTGVTLVR
ncbi:MAG: SMC family ATPase [Acidimicrobiia bacterium]|nr:SMC family ATPase [Acidimicrobiia bacterium]